MKLAVRGVGLSVTPSLRRYVDEKLVRPLDRLLGRHPAYVSAIFELELINRGGHHRKGKVWEAVLNLRLPQQHVYERSSAEDLHAAIDALEDVLKRELTKYKERSRSRLLRGARRVRQQIRFDRSTRISIKGRNRQEGV